MDVTTLMGSVGALSFFFKLGTFLCSLFLMGVCFVRLSCLSLQLVFFSWYEKYQIRRHSVSKNPGIWNWKGGPHATVSNPWTLAPGAGIKSYYVSYLQKTLRTSGCPNLRCALMTLGISILNISVSKTLFFAHSSSAH